MVLISQGEGEDVDYKFVHANPDLKGNIDTLGTLLSAWLSSEGLDLDSVSFSSDGGKTFSSGFERLLALIDKFQATKDDMEIFRDGEKNEFEIIKAYLKALGNDQNQLSPEYRASGIDNVVLNIEFAKPEQIETRAEKLETIKKGEEYGYESKITAIKELKGLKTDEEAEVYLELIKKHNEKVAEIMGEAEPEAEEAQEDEEEAS